MSRQTVAGSGHSGGPGSQLREDERRCVVPAFWGLWAEAQRAPLKPRWGLSEARTQGEGLSFAGQ